MNRFRSKILENIFGNMSYDDVSNMQDSISLDKFLCRKQNLIIGMLHNNENGNKKVEKILAVYINDYVVYDVCNKRFYPLYNDRFKYENYVVGVKRLFGDASRSILLDYSSISNYMEYLIEDTDIKKKILKK